MEACKARRSVLHVGLWPGPVDDHQHLVAEADGCAGPRILQFACLHAALGHAFHQFSPAISRASSFAFRDRTAGARLIGGELGVDFLLYGSVRRTESRLRVTAELVRADNEAVIWVERYDRTTDAIFDVVDEMCGMIVASIVGRLEDELLRNAKRKPTKSLAAFELALRGRALMHGPGRADKLEARRFFEEAVRLDPNYAMALTQLAYTHLYEFFWDDSGRALEKAAKIASSALLVDEEEAWCHMVLGLTHLLQAIHILPPSSGSY